MLLKDLNLNNNQIDRIPIELFELKLFKLGLKQNSFTEIPFTFHLALKNL